MRFDLFHEHDRFIPGWHSRREPPRMRAEYMLPACQLPLRLWARMAEAASWFLAILPKPGAAARSRPGSVGRQMSRVSK
jgi:hypothetical protein